MPTYVYECSKCGEDFEVWQSFSDETLKKHPGCGGKLAKVFQPVGIVFKGSGFHRTDSRSNVSHSRSDSSRDTKDSDSAKSEPAQSERASDSSKPSTEPGDSTTKKASDTKKSGDSKKSTPSTTSNS